MLGVSASCMLVIDGLDAPSAGNVVFVARHLQTPVIGQFDAGLDKSLAVGAGAEDHGSVEILQGSAGDFAGNGGGIEVL